MRERDREEPPEDPAGEQSCRRGDRTIGGVRTRAHPPGRTICAVAAGAGLLVAACGGGSDRGDDAAATDVPPIATAATAATSPSTGPPAAPTSTSTSTTDAVETSLDDPAVVTEPADRITDDAVVTWIGGSDVVLDDRDLPAAVNARVGTIGDRPLTLVADTLIAPTVADVRARVSRAADRGVHGLIVALNPSWVHWDGSSCDGMTPKEVRYACLMSPASAEVTDRNAAELTALVDAVVATDLPAYLYVIPHSTDALAHPELAGPITSAEAALLALDPGVDRVELVGIFNRGLDGMTEGDGFINIVHPDVVGVDRLADWLAADLIRFWTDTGL
jgi:hypothetical protein